MQLPDEEDLLDRGPDSKELELSESDDLITSDTEVEGEGSFLMRIRSSTAYQSEEQP